MSGKCIRDPLLKRNFRIARLQQDSKRPLHAHLALAERSHVTTQILRAMILEIIREYLGTK